jgi:hypothetical protein
MELYLGILLGLVAVGLVLWALVRPRKGEVPHCRRCGFSLAGLTEPGRCPECGSELARKRAVVIGERRRKRRPMWWAAGLVVAATAMLLVDRASVTGYMPVPEYKPAWLLTAEAYVLGDRRASMATDEIVRRVQLGELPVEHEERLVSISLARHAQTWRSFPDAQWQVITDEWAGRQLTTAQIRRVLGNIFEDGFVIGYSGIDIGHWYDSAQLDPGRRCSIDIGVRLRAGRLAVFSTAFTFMNLHSTIDIHERPDLAQFAGWRFSTWASLKRAWPTAGQPRIDSQDSVALTVPWIDGDYSSTIVYRFEISALLQLASDAKKYQPGTPIEYASLEIPFEFEVVSTEEHRFQVVDVASLPGEASSYVGFISKTRYSNQVASSPYMLDLCIELKQSADIDWEKVVLAGHLVFRQGDRVVRYAFEQPNRKTKRFFLHLSPLTLQDFEPGEIRVTYEHNEALANLRFRTLYYNVEQILGGPIELGMITIPEPSEPE